MTNDLRALLAAAAAAAQAAGLAPGVPQESRGPWWLSIGSVLVTVVVAVVGGVFARLNAREQARLQRENAAARGSTDDFQAVQRAYADLVERATKMLGEAEDRVASLRAELDAAEAKEEAWRTERQQWQEKERAWLGDRARLLGIIATLKRGETPAEDP